MFAIQIALRALRLPAPMFLGMVLMAVGGIVDVALQLGWTDGHVHGPFAPTHVGHLVAIAGMGFVLAGVVAHGVRRQRRAGAAPHGGLENDANR